VNVLEQAAAESSRAPPFSRLPAGLTALPLSARVRRNAGLRGSALSAGAGDVRRVNLTARVKLGAQRMTNGSTLFAMMRLVASLGIWHRMRR
jgi:hypothetical protein